MTLQSKNSRAQAEASPRVSAKAALSLTIVAGACIASLLLLSGPAGAQAQELTVEKSTNGNDADAAPGPTLVAGDPVSWTYEVVVSGPSTLFDITVTDSSGVVPSCDINHDGVVDDSHIHPGPLDAGQSFLCTAEGTAHQEGVFASVATVSAFNFEGTQRFEDDDPSYYTTPSQFVINPGVSIETLINGVEADASPGPYVAPGSKVDRTYLVTNTGNVALVDLEVTDDAGVRIDCGNGTNVIPGPIAPGGTASCHASSPAPASGSGLQQSTGAVLAAAIDPQTGAPVAQTDAEDPAAFTPAQLPETLAFTGPSEWITQLGALLSIIGASLWLGSRRADAARRNTSATLH